MPELPEVEIVRRTLSRRLIGRTIERVEVRQWRLRYPVDADQLARHATGRQIRRITRRSKYLILALGENFWVVIHLGMTGRLLYADATVPYEKHDHVIFHLDNGKELRFRDARRFGLVDSYAGKDLSSYRFFKNLGVEPLSKAFTAEKLFARSRRLKKPIKTFLMDAQVIVGVGNIYASEALFRARINPKKAAGKLTLEAWKRLVKAVITVLKEAIAKGGTTFSDFEDADGKAGYFANFLKVYDRTGQPCRVCKTKIKRFVQSGRSTYYCPTCQK